MHALQFAAVAIALAAVIVPMVWGARIACLDTADQPKLAADNPWRISL